MSCIFKRISSLVIILLLCFTQYGCQGFRNPSDSIVKEALELNIQLKHQSLVQSLDLDDQAVEVVRIKVDSRNFSPDKTRKLVSVSGSIDCKFNGFEDTVNTPFRLFLQGGEKDQSWSLVEPSSFVNDFPLEWKIYPLPIIN